MQPRALTLLASLALLFSPACTDDGSEPDTGDEQGEGGSGDSGESESGAQFGSCESRTSSEDCVQPGPDADTSCGWYETHEANLINGACSLGEPSGVCLNTSQGDDTCGVSDGNWYMEDNGVTLIVNMTGACDPLPGFSHCAEAADPPAVCTCAV